MLEAVNGVRTHMDLRDGLPSAEDVDATSLLLAAFEEQLPDRLLGNALALLKLLHAVDTFPHGWCCAQCYPAVCGALCRLELRRDCAWLQQ